MRMLLEHGADPAVCATLRCMKRSIDLVKLLVEFGYDIKINKHYILQYALFRFFFSFFERDNRQDS